MITPDALPEARLRKYYFDHVWTPGQPPWDYVSPRVKNALRGSPQFKYYLFSLWAKSFWQKLKTRWGL